MREEQKQVPALRNDKPKQATGSATAGFFHKLRMSSSSRQFEKHTNCSAQDDPFLAGVDFSGRSWAAW
jgi:hypothetical protein